MRVLSVNVGTSQVVGRLRGRPKRSGIDKRPVAGRVAAGPLGLAGDEQVYRHHGGALQALYAYASEDLDFWTRETGRAFDSTLTGENLTTGGIDLAAAVLGETWTIGPGLVVQVTAPRTPCATLGLRVGIPRFVRAFVEAARPGAYLRVLEPADVGAGDAIALADRPAHGLTVRDAFRILTTDKHRAAELLVLDGSSPALEAWARSRAAPPAPRLPSRPA